MKSKKIVKSIKIIPLIKKWKNKTLNILMEKNKKLFLVKNNFYEIGHFKLFKDDLNKAIIFNSFLARNINYKFI